MSDLHNNKKEEDNTPLGIAKKGARIGKEWFTKNISHNNKKECCEKCIFSSEYEEQIDKNPTTKGFVYSCKNFFCPCHPSPHTEEDWEKEFDRKFVVRCSDGDIIKDVAPKKFKSFIKSLAQSQYQKGREEERSRIKKVVEMKHATCAHKHNECNNSVPCIITGVINSTLIDIIGSIDKEE